MGWGSPIACDVRVERIGRGGNGAPSAREERANRKGGGLAEGRVPTATLPVAVCVDLAVGDAQPKRGLAFPLAFAIGVIGVVVGRCAAMCVNETLQSGNRMPCWVFGAFGGGTAMI